ncbi:MAG: leucine-rich repeat domain-containing protein, partial [Clostridia bacterium]|nr:leucine-rich repeat domain-containing protein [Clostridia bacterium]
MTQFKRMIAMLLAVMLVVMAVPVSALAEEDGMDWSDGEHVYSADCDATCDICGEVREDVAEHQYFYPCDPVCMVCHEVTNPDAAHNVVHVEALDPTCSALGNVEHWLCDQCGSAWTDEAQTQVTNPMSVKLGTVDHVYENGACKWCGEADPNAPADELVSNEVYGGITFDVYEKADGTHKLVISGQTKMGGWTNRNAYQYAATITEVVVNEGITELAYGAFRNMAALKSVTIPSTVTAIPAVCFSGCKALTSFEIPSTITSIGNKAFQASGITSVTI